ncbi:Iron-sulfur cluster assembly scaffold protein IscU-like 1, partial [Homarus americanus]
FGVFRSTLVGNTAPVVVVNIGHLDNVVVCVVSCKMALLRATSRSLPFLAVRTTQVIDHYENPRNVGSMDKNDTTVGTGLVGAPACGDVMKLQIKVDVDGMITEAKFKTFGCGSAIASSSLATEWVKGK